MSIRKFAPSLLPSTTIDYAEEGKPRGGGRQARSGRRKAVWLAVYGTVIACVTVLLVVWVRDWIVLCRKGGGGGGGGGEVVVVDASENPFRSAEARRNYALSKSAAAAEDASGGKDGSDLVELLDGVGGGSSSVRPKVLGFVGIQTGFDSGPRRKSLRETWYPSSMEGVSRLEKATGLAFRFVIGHTKDAWKMKALEEEVAEHKDFMLIDVDENYHKLTLKSLAFFRTAYLRFDADFYIKADDDIYMRPDRLATLLSKPRTSTRIYLGCMKKGPVITDPKLKWHEPKAYMLGSEYFLHAYGPIYGLSSEVVASLSASKHEKYRMFMNEDVTIGVWMLAMDVTHEDNRDICATQCGPTSVAVWDLPRCSGLCNPTERMLELHRDEMCTKSPTLPADH